MRLARMGAALSAAGRVFWLVMVETNDRPSVILSSGSSRARGEAITWHSPRTPLISIKFNRLGFDANSMAHDEHRDVLMEMLVANTGLKLVLLYAHTT